MILRLWTIPDTLSEPIPRPSFIHTFSGAPVAFSLVLSGTNRVHYWLLDMAMGLCEYGLTKAYSPCSPRHIRVAFYL